MIEPEQSMILNVRGGARMCVPADINQITPYVLLEQEDWFEDEIRFVRRWLRPGMQAIDVGASYGLYTVAMARAVGSRGRVWAFEPTPGTADYLQRNLELNDCGNVELKRAAVSDREGIVAFAAGAHSELNAIADAGAPPDDVMQVTAMTLDQMSAGRNWRDIDFVKVDVEGHELEAIRGGTAFLGSASPLIMFEIKARAGVDLRVLDPLTELGYEFFRLIPGPLVLIPYERGEAIASYQVNLFACKADRARKLAAAGFLAGPGAADVPKPSRDVWGDYALATPYARALAGRWPSKAGFFAPADHSTYLEGLAAFAHSRTVECGAVERFAWLNHAFQCVAEARDVADTLVRRISFARLAWELGWREAAVDALQQATERVASEGPKALEEPFLAPSARYEQLATDMGAAEWLTCAVVEQFEKLRQYSSLYAGMTSLEILEPISDLPYRSAEIDRRRQLVRMKCGLQEAPDAVPMLCTRSDENLNPEFWSRSRSTLSSAASGSTDG